MEKQMIYHKLLKNLVVCIGTLLSLSLSAMDPVEQQPYTMNIASNARSKLQYERFVNNTLNIDLGNNAAQTIDISKEGGNNAIAIKTMANNSSLHLHWWSGNPFARIEVTNMGNNAKIYNGVSNLKYYTSVGAALGVGFVYGWCIFKK
jgi:hypothetical protein